MKIKIYVFYIMTEPKPLTEPTIFKVADIISNMGYGREAVKIMVKDEDEPGKKQKKPILSEDALSLARRKYYEDVPNMSKETILREKNPNIIPQMTIQQLRELSDDLYKNMSNLELNYRRMLFLHDNPDFPEEIRRSDSGTHYNPNLGAAFMYQWSRAGTETTYTPTIIFDRVLPRHMGEHYNEEWRKNNERRFFENVYRALILPLPLDGGRKRYRRKSRKSRKNKRKTKRRRS
jgi:hypothetical protein